MRFALVLLLTAAACPAQSQPVDEDYTADIRKFTTAPHFLTELVDHLPASTTVPSPKKFLGYAAGAPDVLTYARDIHRYLRAVAAASPRVRVEPMGVSEEGREMVLVLVSCEENLSRLERLRDITARLADPRRTPQKDANVLAAEGRVFYWVTAAIHPPETGAPEMVMELVYRLAVSESPLARNIRRNTVVMITPVIEVDGRERMVDLYRWRKANPGKNPPPLLYWGRYVVHDNNRDGIALSLALSRNVTRAYFNYHPQVLHDLHESVPFLYTSTGMGPYNAWLDPIVTAEWQELAWYEVREMTKRGVPGVWTFGFYDGWGANYMMEVAHGHNSIGRFYETFGNGGADTRKRSVSAAQTQRAWFRQNPPFPNVLWSHRNNVNLQQSALLLALDYAATHRETFLKSFWLKSRRSVDKARTEGPAAYVIDAATRPAEAASLMQLLRRHGVEIHRLTADCEVAGTRFAQGSYVVRMDQPYSRLADMLLDRQYYNPSDTRPYDDTGWTLPALRNLSSARVADVAVLQRPMEQLEEIPLPAGGVRGEGAVILIPHTGERAIATFRYRIPAVPVEAAAEEFEAGGRKWAAGTLLIREAAGRRAAVEAAAAQAGVTGFAVPSAEVKSRPLHAARIALIHTWTNTQQEGWVRLALENAGIPYSYISVHAVRDTPNLRDRYDVLILGPVTGGAQRVLHGIPLRGEPIPWQGSAEYPHIAASPARSPDIRGGLGFAGLANLQRFVDKGGLFITMGPNAALPVELGLIDTVQTVSSGDLNVRGSVLEARFSDKSSAIAYGYGERLPVYFNLTTLLEPVTAAMLTGGGGGTGGSLPGRASGRGGPNEADAIQGRPPHQPIQIEEDTPDSLKLYLAPPEQRPKVILRFAPEQDLLISGLLANGGRLAGKPAAILAPAGKGNYLMLLLNPFWREQTQGSFMLVLNAAMQFDVLSSSGQ